MSDADELREDPPLNGRSIEVGLFTCPERTEVPSDFIGFKRGDLLGDLTSFTMDARSMAETWVDPSCLAGCDASSCDVRGCVTPAGATVDYVMAQSGNGVDDVEELVLTIVVEAPGTETWSEFVLELTQRQSSSEYYTFSDTTFSVSWVGELDDRWPSDSSVSGHHYDVYDYYNGSQIAGSWDDGDCGWAFDRVPVRWSMEVTAPSASDGATRHTAEVNEGKRCGEDFVGLAWVDDVEQGYVELDGWSPIACRE